MDEPHDVVKLLLARMESHPEEFRVGGKPYSDRWDEHVSDIQAFGNAVDTAALDAKLRDIRLGEIHERVMEELLSGPERRRKHAEDTEYERNLSKSLLLTQHQMMQQVRQNLDTAFASAYTSQLGVGTTGTLTNTINPIKQALGAKK